MFPLGVGSEMATPPPSSWSLGGDLSEEGIREWHPSRKSTEVLDLSPKWKSGDHSFDLWVSS